MSEQSSINFDNESSFFIEPPRTIGNLASHSAGKSRFLNEDPQKSKNKMERICVDVVGEDRSNRMKVSNTFGNFMQNIPKSKVIHISFMGAKRIGKSFLLDCILSHQSPPLGRLMCKSEFYPITTSFPPVPVGEQNNIVYLDCGGQISPINFLATYLISSVVVYNMSPNKHNEESTLLEYLGYIYNRLQLEIGSEEMLKPKLIIVKRDVTGKDNTQSEAELFRKIEELKLLQSIHIFHLPYPTSPNTPSKEICDLPPHLLSQNFLSQVISLSNLLITSCPKSIPYQLTNRTAAPFLEHLLLAIEKNGAIDLTKMENDQYSDGRNMKKQLSNEEALTKYEMYRKLRAIKKETDRKIDEVEGEEVGHFSEIKEKINEFVKKKEELVRGVNAAKSREVHESNWKSLIEKHTTNNMTAVVDEYIKSPLDDQKIEVLLENFNELAQMQPTIQVPNIYGPEMGILDAELQEIEKEVFSKSGLRELPKLSNYQESLEMKKSQLQKVEEEYSYLVKEPNFVLDEGVTNLKEIQEEKERLNQHIKDYENEIENLNQQKNKKIQESLLKLEKELQMEEDSLIRARQGQQPNKNVPYGSKVSNAGKVTKRTCCCEIM